MGAVRFERRAVRDASKWLLVGLPFAERRIIWWNGFSLAQNVLLKFCSFGKRVTAYAFIAFAVPKFRYKMAVVEGPFTSCLKDVRLSTAMTDGCQFTGSAITLEIRK